MLPEAGVFEIAFLAAVALIVVGPKDLPVLLRKVGQFTAKMRGLAAEFRASFDEMARQSELDELRKEVDALRNGQFASNTTAALNSHVGDLNSQLNSSYWDAQVPGADPAADPVQSFVDPHTGLMVGEGEETAALPPPGARTPPLPAKTPRKQASASKAMAQAAEPKAVAASKARAAAKPAAAARTVAAKPAPKPALKVAAKATPKVAKAEPVAAPVAEPARKRAPKVLLKAAPKGANEAAEV